MVKKRKKEEKKKEVQKITDINIYLNLCIPEMQVQENRDKHNNYLQEGKRIENLARAKKKREIPNCYQEKQYNIFRYKIDNNELWLESVEKKICVELKKSWGSCKTKEDFKERMSLEKAFLLGNYMEDFNLDTDDTGNMESGFRLSQYHQAVLSVRVKLLGMSEAAMYSPLGGKGKVRRGFWYLLKQPKENFWLGSVYEAIAHFMLVDRIQKALWEQDAESLVVRRAETLMEEMFQYDYKVGNKSDTFFVSLLKENGYELDYEELIYRKAGNRHVVEMDEVFTESAGRLRAEYLAYRCLRLKEKLPVESLLEVIENPAMGPNGLWFVYPVQMNRIISGWYQVLYEACEDFLAQQEYEHFLERSVATVYMTKKNIPQRMIKEMENSHFNQSFGYVEYDEDVDIDAAKAIAEEFVQINSQLFSGIEHKNCAMRIRKLGKHHALGLYFPRLNCLCIDIHSPESFLHEYYHLLDDQMGGLSERYEFLGICKEYRRLLKEQMIQDKALGKVLGGNGKYNYRYYSRPTEIFARCGEIYLGRQLLVKSSLLKSREEEQFAYPKSEMLDFMIKEYFEQFHAELGKKNG